MTSSNIDDINVKLERNLITPLDLKKQLPLSLEAELSVSEGRRSIKKILNRSDHRLMVVVGPCSIHDVDSAIEYARKLRKLREKVKDTLLLIMRVYFEKPRTTIGWKGMINDPHLDGSFQLEEGLLIARGLLLDIAEAGIPIATEALDPITPQYLHDLVSWTAIGARTTESQTHREMASGLSTAVGFKNSTEGGLEVAINALNSSCSPHNFLGISKHGTVAVITTSGNPYGHIILRGGATGPNYSAGHVLRCEQLLTKNNLAQNIMIDCSHANCKKNAARQIDVVDDIALQISKGNNSIVGFMLESNLNDGNQPLTPNKSDLLYGVSITDPCIDWDTTEQAILTFADRVREPLLKRISRNDV